jgi:hypothetical protein
MQLAQKYIDKNSLEHVIIELYKILLDIEFDSNNGDLEVASMAWIKKTR